MRRPRCVKMSACHRWNRSTRRSSGAPRAAPRSRSRRTSVDLDASPELLILVADELDRLLVHHRALVDADGERLRVRFRVLDRDVDLELAEDRAAEALREFRLIAVRTPAHVQPSVGRTGL